MRGSVGKEGASRWFFGVDAVLVEEEAELRIAGPGDLGSVGFKRLRCDGWLPSGGSVTANPSLL